MGIWIRSQSKRSLINIINIYLKVGFLENEVCEIRGTDCACTDEQYYLLGQYNSEERCLEILNEIEEMICACGENSVFGMPKE